jgi:hypothetical protein
VLSPTHCPDKVRAEIWENCPDTVKVSEKDSKDPGNMGLEITAFSNPSMSTNCVTLGKSLKLSALLSSFVKCRQ